MLERYGNVQMNYASTTIYQGMLIVPVLMPYGILSDVPVLPPRYSIDVQNGPSHYQNVLKQTVSQFLRKTCMAVGYGIRDNRCQWLFATTRASNATF